MVPYCISSHHFLYCLLINIEKMAKYITSLHESTIQAEFVWIYSFMNINFTLI